MTEKIDRRFAYGFLTIAAIVVFWLNTCFHFCSDDCMYALSGCANADGTYFHLGSVANAWIATWGSPHRPVVHFLVRVFTGVLPKSVFNVCNATVMLILFLLIIRYARRRWDVTMACVVTTVALVFLILCKGESYLWCSGSINYLWTGTATVGFVLMLEYVDSMRPRWYVVILISLLSFFIGWMQEAFSPPVCLAMAAYSLVHIRQLHGRKFFVMFCYGVGTILLAVEALSWLKLRGASLEDFSITKYLISFIKIAFTVKAVWLVGLLFLIRGDKRGFIRRNELPLEIIAATLLEIIIVKFNGERSLWCANLFAIVILVRETSMKIVWVRVIAIVLIILWCFLALIGYRIDRMFYRMQSQLGASKDNVTVHDYIPCWGLDRFFFQSIYTWQDTEHGEYFVRYVGKKGMMRSLTTYLYENLYLQDNICRAENKISIPGEFYTTSKSNAIITPAKGAWDIDEQGVGVKVVYDYPKGFLSWLKRDMSSRNPPNVADANHAVRFKTAHGDYVLIVKERNGDSYIKSIETINVER